MNLKTFRERITPIQDKLYRFALSIVRDGAEAEDIVQEVCIKLWGQWDEICQIHNLEAWSMRLTKNLSIDKLRSKHRRTGGLEQANGLAGGLPTPYESAEAGDTLRQIRRLMEKLPANQRNVMQLRDIEGMSYQEISEVLDMPLNQVKINLFRARQQLRNQLINSQIV